MMKPKKMYKMRKLIVRLFALDYVSILFGIRVNWTRSANVIFPSLVLMGSKFPNNTYSGLMFIDYLILAVFLIGVFFGFVYFRYSPVDFKELSHLQKWMYGHYQFAYMTKFQKQDHEAIKKYYQMKWRDKTFWGVVPFLWNPVICVVSIWYYWL